MSAGPTSSPRPRTWPEPAQFNEAVQNLASTMSDRELQGGQAELGPLGMPMPYAGNFADVYKVHCPATGNTWAVKFFKREVRGLRERYRAISDHLIASQLPFMVDFRYLDEGVRIGGGWYPILKLRWIEGQSLNRFVAQSLGQPKLLDQLLDLWVKLAARLRTAGIAHADLQHGNVVLVPESASGRLLLKLIDYDGMYVPALAGQQSGELGHANYQHPQRAITAPFNADLDRFSHLAICTALRCLRVGGLPLWERFNNHENLLFTAQDFAEPGESKLFRELWTLRDARAHYLVGQLALATQRQLETAPLLDELSRTEEVPKFTYHEEREISNLLGMSDVVEVVIAPPLPAKSNGVAPHITLFPPLHDAAEAQPDKVQPPSPVVERLALALLIVLLVVLIVGSLQPWFPTTLVAVLWLLSCGGAFALLRHSFLTSAENLQQGQAMRQLASARGHWRALQRQRESMDEQLAEAEKAVERIEEEYRASPNWLAKKQHETKAQAQELRSLLAARLAELQAQERTALGRHEQELQHRQAPLLHELQNLDYREQQEIDAVLHDRRTAHIFAYMQSRLLMQAPLREIGPKLKATLTRAGFRTAHDVLRRDVRAVKGVGESRATTLVGWANSELALAQGSFPSAIVEAARSSVSSKNDSYRRHLRQQIDSMSAARLPARQAIHGTFVQQARQLDFEEDQIRLWLENTLASLPILAKEEQQRVESELRTRQWLLAQEQEIHTQRVADLAGPMADARAQVTAAEAEARRFDSLTFDKFLLRVAMLDGIGLATARRA